MNKFFNFMFFVLLVIAISAVVGWISETKASEILRGQIMAMEDSFQVYRSAAADAYGWALGSDSEYGEKIPAEFFWRYDKDVKNAEESALLYFQAGEIVKERIEKHGLKPRGYSYRTVINN